MKLGYKIFLPIFVILMTVSGLQVLAFANESSNDTMSNVAKSSAVIDNSNTVEKVSSPRVQTEEGVPPLAIACNSGLKLILKASDGSPACVFPSSIDDLVARGWAQSQAWEEHD